MLSHSSALLSTSFTHAVRGHSNLYVTPFVDCDFVFAVKQLFSNNVDTHIYLYLFTILQI